MSSENPGTRTRILDVTWRMLEANPAKPVRMADIAKRAGISRQALYLHFRTRADLLIATTLHLDEVNGAEQRLVASRTAATGIQRLDAFIEAWGSYLPEIHGVARALLAMKDTDEAAAKAWELRMQAMRQGCEAAVAALERDGKLSPHVSPTQATDLLWTLLSVRNWEQLTTECGWSQRSYIEITTLLARRMFVTESNVSSKRVPRRMP